MAIIDRLIGFAGDVFAEESKEPGLDRPIAWLRQKGGSIMVNRIVAAAIPFTARNRFHVEVVHPGYVRARVAIKGNRNHFGSLYAGAYFLVAEIPGGVLTLVDLGPAYVPILTEMNLQFIKAANSDVTVEMRLPETVRERVRSEADETGRSTFTLEGELYDDEGNVVARSQAYYQVRKKQ